MKYWNRQGHLIEYFADRRKKKLFVDGYPFSRDTMKNGWVYWRCVGYRKTGLVWFLRKRRHYSIVTYLVSSISDVAQVPGQGNSILDWNSLKSKPLITIMILMSRVKKWIVRSPYKSKSISLLCHKTKNLFRKILSYLYNSYRIFGSV